MRVLFDQGTPRPLRNYLGNCEVSTAFELGWSTLTNGNLLRQAETAGFEVLVTTDTNLKHQQNLAECRLKVLVLLTTSWPRIRRSAEKVADAMQKCQPGVVYEIDFPK